MNGSQTGFASNNYSEIKYTKSKWKTILWHIKETVCNDIKQYKTSNPKSGVSQVRNSKTIFIIENQAKRPSLVRASSGGILSVPLMKINFTF